MNALQNKIIHFYRNWTKQEELRTSALDSLVIVVDDLAPSTTVAAYEDQRDLETQLAELISECVEHGDCDLGHPYKGFTLSKLRQSYTYLTNNKPGLVTKEIAVARGALWDSVPMSDLEELHRRISVGKAKIDSDQIFEKVDAQQTPAKLQAFTEKWVKKAKDVFPFYRDFSYDIEPVLSPDGWRHTVSFRNGRFRLITNLNPKIHRTLGSLENSAIHEVCGHMLHFSCLKESSAAKAAPHLLCLTLHTMDSFLMEGVAQILSKVLISRTCADDSSISVAFDQYVLGFAVRQKNVIDLVEATCTLDEAAERHATLVGGSVADLKHIYGQLMEDPMSTVQVLNYYSSYKALLPILKMPHDQQNIFLQELLTGFYSPLALKNGAEIGRLSI